MERLIVKYEGFIERYNIVEILSDKFAIIIADVEDLKEDKNIIAYEVPNILYPMVVQGKESSCITINNNNFSGLTGKGVIVGIIDSGITYNHREFQGRVKFIWDIPNDRVYNEEEINGGIDFRDSIGHGTGVAGIAVGSSGVASESDIIAVSIGRGSSDDIMRGIKFVIDKAKERNVPCVINISYGTNFGGHNGQSLFEQYINQVSEENVVNIVIASGNEGDKLHHFRGQGNNVVEFNVGRSLRSVRLELYQNYLYNIEFEIISPNGNRTGVLSGADSVYSTILYNTSIDVKIDIPTPDNVDQRIIIELTGKEFVDGGIWRIVINTDEDNVFDIWLPVSEGVTEDTVFLGADINTTLTIPSTSYRAITVGAYNSENNTIAPFSGRGYTRDVVFVKPDITAPGVNIRTASNSGGYDFFTGTSFATPFVTGVCALLMEWGIVNGNDENMYGERIKALIRKYATRSSNIVYPNNVWGYGRLCFRNIYNNLGGISTMSINDIALSDEYVPLVIGRNDDLLNVINNYSAGRCDLIFSDYSIVYVDTATYELLLTNSQIGNGIRSSTPLLLGYSGENVSIPEDLSTVTNLPVDYRGNGVFVGVACGAIDLNDPDLKYENGESRIYSIWIQDDEESSENVCFGKTYNREEITNGQVTMRGDTLQGTNVLKSILRVAPDVEFVVVKLKGAGEYYRNQVGIKANAIAYESSDIMLAVDYMSEKAKEERRPLSVLIDVGTNMGAHDGQSLLEVFLSNIALSNGAVVTTAIGNEALSSRHTSFEINNDVGYNDVEINVGDNAKNFTVWIYSNISERVDVGIIPPIGNEIRRIEARNNFINTYTLNLTNTNVTVEYRIPLYRTSIQATIISVKGAVAGIWKIRVYGRTNIGKINCWLPISSFVDDISFLSPVASCTAVVPSTAPTLITVGAYDSLNNRIIATSGRGPNRVNVLKPDFVAPSNGSTAISGAIVSAMAALLLEWGIVRGNNLNLDTLSIKSFIVQGCFPLESNTPVPNNIWGYGGVNLFDTFAEL